MTRSHLTTVVAASSRMRDRGVLAAFLRAAQRHPPRRAGFAVATAPLMIYGMASTDPTSLDRLHDIIAPQRVPWWPPAPGWYWVLGFLFVLVLVLVLRALLRWLHNCYRREALAELARQEANLADTTSRAAAITTIAELLKRTALSGFPRETVASLTGPTWFAFLNSTRGRAKALSADKGEWFERMAYEPSAATSVDERQAREFASLARDWIAHHRATEVSGGNNT